jgi:hypothetical protein
MGLSEEILQGIKETIPTATGRSAVAPDVSSEVQAANTTEVKNETQSASTEKIETTAPIFDVTDFNEKYGKKYNREIKEEKDLEELFSAPTRISDYESKLKAALDAHELTKKQFNDLTAEYESKKENLKLINLEEYVGKDLLKISEMRKKYPDKDIAIMTQIGSMDLDKADPVDLLVKQARLNDSDIYQRMDDSTVKEVLSGDFDGIDLNDPDSWDEVAKARIAKASKQARIEFKALQNVELPVPIDIEKVRQDFAAKDQERYNQTKQQWQPIVDKMIENLSKDPLVFKGKDGKDIISYTPEVDDSFKNEATQYLDFLAHTGQPINETTIQNVLEGIKGRYVARDGHKITEAAYLKGKTEEYDKWHNETHNDAPLSTKTAPAGNKMDYADRMIEFMEG